MLVVTGLNVAYRKVPALSDVSLRVDQGQVVGLIGPNGAGKSTLVKAIAGLVKITSGSIVFEDANLVGMSTEDIVRRGIAFVPEGRHIFQTLSVRENLSLGYASGQVRDSSHYDEVLDQFAVLRKFHDQTAAGLSGGEQQQLAIARALLSRPRLLILDEPSLGLAPLMVDLVFDVLTTLRREGTTVLLVEQNALRTVTLADRTYVLGSGRVRAEGSKDELLSRDDILEAYLGKRV